MIATLAASIPPAVMEALTTVNWVVVYTAGACMALPMIYFFLMLIPQKKYKEAKKQHKYIVVSCARNESNVITHLIDSIRAQNYPRELLDIMVVAHNCQDDTAKVAREAGADYVIEHNDPDPKHGRKGYALQVAFREILDNHPEYEGIMIMDADNLMNVNFVKEMNKAFDSGVEVGTGYRNSKNYDDNCVAGSNGLTFLRDCRANGHGRTLVHSTVPLAGTGFFIRRSVAADMGGWTAFNLVEDFEYTLQLLMKKHRVQYVSKAEFFDEQPHGLKSSLIRQTRLGKGVFILLFKYGPRMLFKFFTTFWFGFLDMFLYLLYPLVAFLATFWFPFYYILTPVVTFIDLGMAAGTELIVQGIIMQVVIYVIGTLTLQNIVLMIIEHKRLNFKKWYRILTTLIAYPWYNLLCAVAITIGVLTPNLTWRPTVHDRPMSLTQIVGNQGVALAGADSGATAAAVSCVATGDSVVVAQDTASNLAVDEVYASKDTLIDK